MSARMAVNPPIAPPPPECRTGARTSGLLTGWGGNVISRRRFVADGTPIGPSDYRRGIILVGGYEESFDRLVIVSVTGSSANLAIRHAHLSSPSSKARLK